MKTVYGNLTSQCINGPSRSSKNRYSFLLPHLPPPVPGRQIFSQSYLFAHQGLTTTKIPSAILQTDQGIVARIFVEISLKYGYPSMVGENDQIYGVQIIGTCICQSNIYYALQVNPHPQSHPLVLTINHKTEGNYLLAPFFIFCLSISPLSPAENGGSRKLCQV